MLRKQHEKHLSFLRKNEISQLTNKKKSMDSRGSLCSEKEKTLNKAKNIMDFVVPKNYRIDLKESETIDKYAGHIAEIRKLQNIKVTVVLVINGALRTLVKKLRENKRKKLQL